MNFLRQKPVLAALAAAGALAAYVAFGGKGGAKDADLAHVVARGAAIYAENCAECHGENLEGQFGWRRRLADGTLPAPPHDETGHTWHHTDEQNFGYTKSGGQALMPPGRTSGMPAFGDVLMDDDIRAVLAFIKSKWPESIRNRSRRM